MENKQKQLLRKKAQETTVTAAVGKNGLTAEVTAELLDQLKRRKLIKIRVPPGFEFSEEDITALRATLIDKRGHTVVLARGDGIVKN